MKNFVVLVCMSYGWPWFVLHLKKVNLSCRVTVCACWKLLRWEAFPASREDSHTSRLPRVVGIMAESGENKEPQNAGSPRHLWWLAGFWVSQACKRFNSLNLWTCFFPATFWPSAYSKVISFGEEMVNSVKELMN